MFRQWMAEKRGLDDVNNSFTISRIKLTYTGPRTVAYATSEGRHCDLPLSTKGKLYPVYTMVKIDPSLSETKKV